MDKKPTDQRTVLWAAQRARDTIRRCIQAAEQVRRAEADALLRLADDLRRRRQ